jgi:TolA protein
VRSLAEGSLVEVRQNDFNVGLLLSFLGHALLFYAMLFLVTPRWNKLGEPVVYSITLEGGKTLGGISQVPANDKKEPVAPPKNVSAPEQQPKEEKAEDLKNAEVSLSEKKKEAEKPKVEEKKPEETKKEEKKATPKPTPKQPTSAEIDKEYQKAMQRYRGESTDAGGKGFGAARLGGNGMGGGVLRPPEFFQYRDLLRTYIKKGWRWFDTSAQLTAVVAFEMSPKGEITNVAVVTGSGNREYDDSVIRAVYKASPAPPPPESVYEFFQQVRIEFQPGD